MPAPPKSIVPLWWRRALDDGRNCENTRRERWFTDYFNTAESELTSAGLIPPGLEGPFWLLYRKGFRLGYDNALLERKRARHFLPRKRRRDKLGK